jgi:hypothetical protein
MKFCVANKYILTINKCTFSRPVSRVSTNVGESNQSKIVEPDELCPKLKSLQQPVCAAKHSPTADASSTVYSLI